jgi:hypothetical protein
MGCGHVGTGRYQPFDLRLLLSRPLCFGAQQQPGGPPR